VAYIYSAKIDSKLRLLKREMVNDTKNGSMNLFKKIQEEEEEEAYGAHISKFRAIDWRIFQV
jgi:hypothetical protein